MEQQELEKILSMMRLELSYQLRKFFDNTGSPMKIFPSNARSPYP